MSYLTDAERRQSAIDGLRALADFLAEHPDVPVGNTWTLSYHACGRTDEEQRTEVDRVAAILGVTPGTPLGPDHYLANRSFGGVEYEAIAITAEHMRRYDAERSYAGSVEPDAQCKCGFRAPELGPHPLCPIHSEAEAVAAR